jgi:hypothetical protein
MRACERWTAVVTLGACLAYAGPAVAQGVTISEAECQKMRQRLAEHARLSEGVRAAMMTQARAAGPVATPAAPAGRAEAIRARLEQIPRERQMLEEQRLGAMVRLDVSRAGQIQGQIQALDAEKAGLEREQAALPAGAAASPTPPVQAASDDATMRIRCQDMPAALDSALKTRRRELGAREEQTGAIPLIGLKGQTAEQIAGELADQFAAGPAASTQVGLFDPDGDGRLDGFVDAPSPGIFRLVRQRADGTVGIELFRTVASGATPAYGELTRRLEETAARQTGQNLADLLAVRPASALRPVTQTAEFEPAYAQFQAGNFGEVARGGGAAARSAEFQNLRGQNVRVLEVIGPAAAGFSVRRTAVLALPNDQELWEDTTTIVQPSSYWRTDVEVSRTRQTRTTSGAAVGAPSAAAPAKFSLDR